MIEFGRMSRKKDAQNPETCYLGYFLDYTCPIALHRKTTEDQVHQIARKILFCPTQLATFWISEREFKLKCCKRVGHRSRSDDTYELSI